MHEERHALLIDISVVILYLLLSLSIHGPKWFTRLIMFPGEFKKDHAVYNMNQLIMVLTTAQSHAKISLENSVIMSQWTFGFMLRIGMIS